MRTLLLMLCALLTFSSFAQDDPYAGAIPLSYQDRPATDLTYKGRTLKPKEAAKLYEDRLNGRGKPTLHLYELNPIETTDIWTNTFPNTYDLEKANLDDLPIEELNDEVTYLSDGVVRGGVYKFNIMKMGDGNIPKMHSIILGKKLHNILLRKALLRKIGYNIGPIKYIKKIDVRFRSMEQIEKFKSAMALKAEAAPSRWIINTNSQEFIVTLQDVAIMEPIERFFNFALGDITEEIIEGRRLVNSLLIPFNLVDSPETLNLFNKDPGTRTNEFVFLPYDLMDQFYTSSDDAIWITNRILKLDDQDWNYIAKQGMFPNETLPRLLKVLKLRRNSLARLFRIKTNKLEIKGKVPALTTQEYEGYASRFAHGLPESPLSRSNVTAMIKSKATGLVLDAAMSVINSFPYLGTQIKKLNEFHRNNYDNSVKQAIEQSIKDGVTHESKVGTWTFPTFSGSLNVSRNIVTGSVLGTDQMIQLVDNIGFNVSAGLFTGFAGLPKIRGISKKIKQELGLGVSANVMFNRNYSHLKPVRSIQKALKEPFRNLITVMRKKQIGNLLNSIIADPDQDPEKIEKVLKVFKDNIEIGESFLITDKIVVGAQVMAKIALFKFLNASINIAPSNLTVFRLHINRKSENTFHIYRDFGDLASINLALGLNSVIPVLKTSLRFSKGIAKTKFYSVNISKENPKLVGDILALRQAIVQSDLDLLNEFHPPYTITNKFNENNVRLGIFTLRFNKIKSNANYVITNPHGESKELFRVYSGHSIGMNYQAYVSELIGQWVGKVASGGFSMTGMGDGNPGYSIYGKGENRYSVFEAFVNPKGKFVDPLVKVSRVYNGWEAKQKKVEKILEKMHNRYQFPYYNEHLFDDISKLFLYNIKVNFVFFKEAFAHILTLDKAQIKKIFTEHSNKNAPGAIDNGKILSSLGYKRFVKHIRKYKGEKSFHNNTNAEKIDPKYCKKLNNLRSKFDGLQRNELVEIVISGICSKEQFKEFKYLARITKKYSRNCTRIKNLLSKDAKLEKLDQKYTVADIKLINGVLTTKKCTYKQFRKFKILNTKRARKIMANHVIRLFELAESKLTVDGILKLVGGKKNLYSYSSIEGFKHASEYGDQTFYSNTIGELGNKDAEGPSAFILRKTGMSPAEFYSYWLMGRVI